MGTLSAHVDDDLEQRAKAAAKERAHGKMSAYLGELIRRDLDGQCGGVPDSKDPDCMVKLCEQFVSFLAPTMRRTCEGRDQPRILGAFLANFALGKIDISEDFLAMLEDFRTRNPSKK